MGRISLTRSHIAVVLTVLGVILVSAGVAAVFWPAALVVLGAACGYAGLFGLEVDE